ncbi:MAG: hypothetical protein FWE82_05935, partial [Defluviitaleaceae bacterium]|nr:hypothetical protein [Defluviitaleaceae bacterium]
NTAGFMNLPGNPESMPLIELSWKENGASAAFDFGSTDASDYRAMIIDIAQDSSNSLNRRLDQRMKIILTDTHGNSQAYLLPRQTAALKWQRGTVNDIPNFQGDVLGHYYSELTPISNIILPFAFFTEIDLHNLCSMTMEMNTFSGCVMLKSIYLVK